MKLYYNGKGYTCSWKTLISDNNIWYNMEPVKIKVTMPRHIYDIILLDIKLDNENKTLHDIFRFNLLLQKGEMSRNKEKLVIETNEYWKINAYLDRCTITSQFRNGDVTAIFEISIFEEEELDKSEVRNILLNQLI